MPERQVTTPPLSDRAWQRIAKRLPPADTYRHLTADDPRQLVEAMRHVILTGCDWRALPAQYPPYQMVQRQYVAWRRAGLWEPIWALLKDDPLGDGADDQAEQQEHDTTAAAVGNTTELPELPDRLPDEVWAQIAAILPPPSHHGRPHEHPRRRVVEAIVYRIHQACSWRRLPGYFPPVKTVYGQFSRWQKAGMWAQIETILTNAKVVGHLQL